MVMTESSMMALGTEAPTFQLTDVSTNEPVSLQDMQSDVATCIIFTCNHCPFVKHIHDKLLEVIKTYQAKGVNFVAISANDVDNFPEDSPLNMRQLANEYEYTFPYCYDETQEVAKAYGAECTPDFFVFDKNLKCVYRGRFDGATPGNDVPVTGEELTAAFDAIIAGKPVSEKQLPSVGCNVKWK